MRHTRLAASVIIILLALCFTVEARAQQPAQTGILFLRMRLDHGTLTLLSSVERPGKLKLPRGWTASARLPIVYELVSAGGGTIWTGSTEDPTVRRYEFEDPNQPGLLRTIQTVVDSVEFTLRIPAFAGLRRVDLYRHQAQPEGALQKPARVLIGSVTVSPGGGK
jgi:hypothetical protein